MIKYIFGIFTIIGIAMLVWLMELYSQIRFDIDKIIDYNPKQTTQLFDRNGELVANIFDNHHRLYAKYDEIPSRVIESLIAIEDTQFFEHKGVNVDAIGRAIIKDIKARALVEGASTLTQQLVKTMALSREKKLIRKIKEAMLAIKLETVLTKEQIMERYLNQVYFGHRYYGIKTASLGYFRKELNELNIKEIAMLVGLPKAPSFYDPTKNIEHALTRANQVIRRLKKLGWINSLEYNHAIDFVPKVYNDTLSLNKAPYITDEVIRQLTPKFPDLKTAGYKIYLTVDLATQQLARESLQFGYDRVKEHDKNKDNEKSWSKTLNGAIVTMESSTGKILALVGGVDYTKSSFNRATQTKRQPGSAVKPFLYQVGLNLGYSPQSTLIDISRTYEYRDKNNKKKKWQPKNYGRKVTGLVRFKDALVKSKNLATINLVNDIGIDVMHEKLTEIGFKDLAKDLSITLGSFSISPLDMSQMYSTLSNKGMQVKPYLVQSIVNFHGHTIRYGHEEPVEIMEPEQVYLMTDILTEVVTRGTGRRAIVPGIQTAGKTGTTNNYIDAWFCGFTPSIQTIVWYGNDNNTPMNRSETGGGTAAPVFGHFIKNYLALHPEIQREFVKPKEVKEGNYKGNKEFYTNTSPLPEVIEAIEHLEDEEQIIF
ncbi:MAG: PBP1A family penicillin-binding protein [Campylobacterota bacterium]|nr:PBP1A family penicillin-binding protein [Campylobacterota bacterium]